MFVYFTALTGDTPAHKKKEKIMNMNFKKNVALVAVTLLLGIGTFSVALADGHNKAGGFSGPANTGGFSGPGPKLTSIIDASKQADDTWVTLRGNIIQQDGDDKYTFRDASGQGIVEIERKAWAGQNISPSDTVDLITKVDKDWGATELEVKQVRKVK